MVEAFKAGFGNGNGGARLIVDKGLVYGDGSGILQYFEVSIQVAVCEVAFLFEFIEREVFSGGTKGGHNG